MRDALFVAGEAFHTFGKKIHARRQYETVVFERVAAVEADFLRGGVDAGDLVSDDVHTPFLAQIAVADGDVFEVFLADQNQVGDRARHELAVLLDQGDADRAVAPHAQIFRRRGAAVAASDDDHVRRARSETVGHATQFAYQRLAGLFRLFHQLLPLGVSEQGSAGAERGD